MVVDEVHVNDVAVFKAKDDAPIRGNLDRPVAGAITLEWVEVKTWQRQIVWASCGVQKEEHPLQFLDQSR